MKKLLIFMLVLGMASLANATVINIIDPVGGTPGSSADPLEIDEVVTIYISVSDSLLDTLSMTITGGGITGGILAAEAGGYGNQGTFYSPPDIWFMTADSGWQAATSADTAVSGGGTIAELGLSQVGNTIQGATTEPVITFDMVGLPNMTVAQSPIAYITIKGTGSNVSFSLANGSQFGSTSIQNDLVTVPGFGGSVMIYSIPEPMTVLLLGLGGLFLRRRK